MDLWQQTSRASKTTHLSLLPTRKGEISLAVLVSPGPPGQRVEDDGVDIIAVVKAGVEVQGQVVGVMADVDGESGRGRWLERGAQDPFVWGHTSDLA